MVFNWYFVQIKIFPYKEMLGLVGDKSILFEYC